MLQNMFFSASKPFYHSASVLSLKPIPLEKYSDFIIRHFRESGKRISAEEVAYVYELFEGHTWYIQSVFYLAYYMTTDICTAEIIRNAIEKKLDDSGEIYESILYGIPNPVYAPSRYLFFSLWECAHIIMINASM